MSYEQSPISSYLSTASEKEEVMDEDGDIEIPPPVPPKINNSRPEYMHHQHHPRMESPQVNSTKPTRAWPYTPALRRQSSNRPVPLYPVHTPSNMFSNTPPVDHSVHMQPQYYVHPPMQQHMNVGHMLSPRMVPNNNIQYTQVSYRPYYTAHSPMQNTMSPVSPYYPPVPNYLPQQHIVYPDYSSQPQPQPQPQPQQIPSYLYGTPPSCSSTPRQKQPESTSRFKNFTNLWQRNTNKVDPSNNNINNSLFNSVKSHHRFSLPPNSNHGGNKTNTNNANNYDPSHQYMMSREAIESSSSAWRHPNPQDMRVCDGHGSNAPYCYQSNTPSSSVNAYGQFAMPPSSPHMGAASPRMGVDSPGSPCYSNFQTASRQGSQVPPPSSSSSSSSAATTAATAAALAAVSMGSPRLSSWLPGLFHFKQPKICSLECPARDEREAVGKIAHVLKECMNGTLMERGGEGRTRRKGEMYFSNASKPILLRFKLEIGQPHQSTHYKRWMIRANFIQQQGDAMALAAAVKMVEDTLMAYEQEAEYMVAEHGWAQQQAI